MPSERSVASLLLTGLAWFLAAVGAQPAPSPAPANATAPVLCNNDFLRSYMLKGYQTGNSNDTFAMCGGVNATCCNRRDQLYIFHYLSDVFPNRLQLVETKRGLLMGRLKRLHRRILRTDLTFPGESERDRFCSVAGRRLTTFNFNQFYADFQKLDLDWGEKVKHRLSSFYCLLCDAKNHRFFDQLPKVAVKQEYCKEVLIESKNEVKFWAKTLMDYLATLQRVVDCNHYQRSFNLTFYNPAKLEQMADTNRCLENMDDDFALNCRKTCARLGLASLTDFLDGDLLFLDKTLNIFEKFNFNREAGQFHSIKLRKFYKRWQDLKQLSLFHLNGTFKDLILNSTAPVDVTINPVEYLQEQLSVPLPRRLGLLSVDPAKFDRPKKERKLTLRQAMQGELDNRPSSEYELRHRAPSNKNSVFISKGFSHNSDSFLSQKLNSLDHFLQNGRRLQAQGAPANSTNATNQTGPQPPKKQPKVWVNSADFIEYDSIVVTKTRHEPDFVFDVFVKPVNIDLIPKVVADEGVTTKGYRVISLDIEPWAFHNMVYGVKKVDTFSQNVEALCESVDEVFQETMKAFLKERIEIQARNYLLPGIDVSAADPSAPKRRALKAIRSA